VKLTIVLNAMCHDEQVEHVYVAPLTLDDELELLLDEQGESEQ
jgi:hypothetical protein